MHDIDNIKNTSDRRLIARMNIKQFWWVIICACHEDLLMKIATRIDQ
jgi:hypothetical protein